MTPKTPWFFAGGLLLSSVLLLVKVFVLADAETRWLRQASAALSLEDWAEAEEQAKLVLEQDPNNPQALAIAGIAAGKQHRPEAAGKYLERVPDDGSPASIAGLKERGRTLLLEGQLTESEAYLQAVLSRAPDDLAATENLATLLSFEGRCTEAGPYWLRLLQHGRFRADELYLLGIPQQIRLQDYAIKQACETAYPVGGVHQLGEAVHALRDHRVERAERLLSLFLPRHPEVGLAQSLQGRLYLERDQLDNLLAWHATLPETVSDHPEIWFVRALWAERSGQTEAVVRCLLEVLKSDPNHVEATYRLSQVLLKLDATELAQRFSARSQSLSKLAYQINDLRGNPDLRLLKLTCEELERLGRNWEALAWAKMAEDQVQNQELSETWPTETLARLRTRAATHPERIHPGLHPLRGIEVEDYPLPVWAPLDQVQSPIHRLTPASNAEQDLASIRFEDLAAQAGVNYEYFNSMDPEIGLEHIFQTTGGGVAALDYDGDYWPDLYFAQGRVLPESLAGFNEPQTKHLDRLFRNRGDGTFTEVTAKALLGDDRFSQGVTHGDFNEDGFPDLYVCNVGGNRFYENNGDGTFTEIAQKTHTAGDEWSMSCLLADLDGDGFSDLYVVNYLKADQVLARSCRKNGEPLTCAPTLFDGERDRVYRNLGDGRFVEETDSARLVQQEGKGLGIVAMNVSGNGRLNLFIANDTTANQYYNNLTQPGGPLRFEESGLQSGLAMSASGVMQACMGVAAGDANGDGLTDLFVTNFIMDYNTLYLQQPDGTFSDETRVARLLSPSVELLGFGTQFVDANLDGHLDLLITNGHVDQTKATGEPDVMPPQFLLNLGGTFAEASADTLGEFFQQKYLGRGMARLDWNRDGLEDVCIVHLLAPSALLTNTTSTSNRAFALHLRGRRSSRDAIGTKVTLQTNLRKITRELTGGDGYQVSNERKLVFGLTDEEQVQRLTISWPTGEKQHFDNLGVNSDYLSVEGRPLFGLEK